MLMLSFLLSLLTDVQWHVPHNYARKGGLYLAFEFARTGNSKREEKSA
jgi:hypothetical protein